MLQCNSTLPTQEKILRNIKYLLAHKIVSLQKWYNHTILAIEQKSYHTIPIMIFIFYLRIGYMPGLYLRSRSVTSLQLCILTVSSMAWIMTTVSTCFHVTHMSQRCCWKHHLPPHLLDTCDIDCPLSVKWVRSHLHLQPLTHLQKDISSLPRAIVAVI